MNPIFLLLCLRDKSKRNKQFLLENNKSDIWSSRDSFFIIKQSDNCKPLWNFDICTGNENVFNFVKIRLDASQTDVVIEFSAVCTLNTLYFSGLILCDKEPFNKMKQYLVRQKTWYFRWMQMLTEWNKLWNDLLKSHNYPGSYAGTLQV